MIIKTMGDANAQTQSLYGRAFFTALALAPVIAILAPRFLAYWPGIIGLAAFAAYPLVFKTIPPLPKTTWLWVCIILGLAGLSCLWAIDPDTALSRTIKVAFILVPGGALITMALSVPLADIKPYLRYFLWAYVAALGLCVDIMVMNFPYEKLGGEVLWEDWLAGAYLNRSLVALLALLFAGTGIVALAYGRKAVMAAFMASGVVLIFTQSQSAQLGLILALVCYFFFPFGQKKIWHGFAAILAAGILLAPFFAIWMFDALAANIADMPVIGQGGGFGGERLEIWDKISRYALRNPLCGFGIEATRVIEDFDTAQIYRKGITELHPHNFAVQLWIEFGLIGAATGAALVIFLLRKISALTYRQAQIALPAFMVLLTAASFGYGLWQGWFLGLFILTIALAGLGIRLYDEDDSER